MCDDDVPSFLRRHYLKNVGEKEKRRIMTHFIPTDCECDNINVKTVQTF